MISDFIVQHPSGPFFSLSETEYKRAIRKYPQVPTINVTIIFYRLYFFNVMQLAKDTAVTYNARTATGSINVGKDGYFDNATILDQFERLFQLIQFKKEYEHHTIECVVDNARTHSAKAHSLLDFGKSSGTRCPVECIEYTDHEGEKQITLLLSRWTETWNEQRTSSYC